MKKIQVIPILILLGLFILGCQMPQSSNTPFSSSGKGSLVISITTNMASAKTLLPTVGQTIATYNVSGVGPSGATFSQQNVTTSVTITLVTGSWVITVNGLNSGGTQIGTGSTAVTITAGQTTNASVTVAPLNGNGDLGLTISWPSGLIAAPSVTGTLTPVGGNASNLTFTLAANSLSASYDSGSTLPAGYYTLSLILMDGTTTVWGGIEAVQMAANSTTVGTFTLTSSDITPILGNARILTHPNAQSLTHPEPAN
jgi:hypothetical protein